MLSPFFLWVVVVVVVGCCIYQTPASSSCWQVVYCKHVLTAYLSGRGRKEAVEPRSQIDRLTCCPPFSLSSFSPQISGCKEDPIGEVLLDCYVVPYVSHMR